MRILISRSPYLHSSVARSSATRSSAERCRDMEALPRGLDLGVCAFARCISRRRGRCREVHSAASAFSNAFGCAPRWAMKQVRPASAAAGSKAAFDILPSGRLRWIVAIGCEPLIKKRIRRHSDPFCQTSNSEPVSPASCLRFRSRKQNLPQGTKAPLGAKPSFWDGAAEATFLVICRISCWTTKTVPAWPALVKQKNAEPLRRKQFAETGNIPSPRRARIATARLMTEPRLTAKTAAIKPGKITLIAWIGLDPVGLNTKPPAVKTDEITLITWIGLEPVGPTAKPSTVKTAKIALIAWIRFDPRSRIRRRANLSHLVTHSPIHPFHPFTLSSHLLHPPPSPRPSKPTKTLGSLGLGVPPQRPASRFSKDRSDCGSCRYAVGAAATVQGRCRVVHSPDLATDHRPKIAA